MLIKFFRVPFAIPAGRCSDMFGPAKTGNSEKFPSKQIIKASGYKLIRQNPGL